MGVQKTKTSQQRQGATMIKGTQPDDPIHAKEKDGNLVATNNLLFENSRKVQFSCLFTKHKTQKRRIWCDGRLVLNGIRATIHDANPPPGSTDPPLDECEVTSSQRKALSQMHETRLETEKFLIQVEGPWAPAAQTLSSINSTSSRSPTFVSQSNSMKKLMQRKFRKPKTFIPPNPTSRQSRIQSILGKRRRPLQPFELQRRYYGTVDKSQLSCTQTNKVARAPSQNQHQLSNSFRQLSQVECSQSQIVAAKQITQAPGVQPRTQQRPTIGSTTNVSVIGEPQPINNNHKDSVGSSTDMLLRQNESMVNSEISEESDALVLQRNYESKRNNTSTLQAPQSREIKTTHQSFLSNDFSANSFYGIEEESDNEHEEGLESADSFKPDIFSYNVSSSYNSEYAARSSQDDIASAHKMVEDPCESGTTPQTNKEKQDLKSVPSTLSGSRLLALFSAAPVQQTNDDASAPIENVDPKNDAPKENSGLEFVLPSASESSSEESSQET